MLRLRIIAFPETNSFIKNITKCHKPRQNVFRARHDSACNDQNLEMNTVKRLPTYLHLARKENLDIEDFLQKEQDQEELESIFKEIARGDAKVEKRLQLLLYEIKLKREDEEQVPKYLKKEHWEELLKLQSLYTRNKYLAFLFKTEKKKESGRIKHALKTKNKMLHEKLLKMSSPTQYGLSGNSIFMRIYPQMLSPILDLKALTNKFFAPPILFDCSYQNYMNSAETKFCAKQIIESVQQNRTHPYPSCLQLVNLKKDDLLMKYLKVHMQSFKFPHPPCEIFENSYLDLYPKERLVYLTPHTKHYLNESRSDDIYIIGAFVDKGSGVQASLAKAKENELRIAKFPIEKYILWKQGSKSLTLNNVVNILLDLRFYNNWPMALRSIPSRNIINTNN